MALPPVALCLGALEHHLGETAAGIVLGPLGEVQGGEEAGRAVVSALGVIRDKHPEGKGDLLLLLLLLFLLNDVGGVWVGDRNASAGAGAGAGAGATVLATVGGGDGVDEGGRPVRGLLFQLLVR